MRKAASEVRTSLWAAWVVTVVTATSLGCQLKNMTTCSEVEPLAEKAFFALTMPGWERHPDIEKPIIVFRGLMTGRSSDDDSKTLSLYLNCRWPKQSDEVFHARWHAPDRWNCEIHTFIWTHSGPSQFYQTFFGQPEGYMGGWHESRDSSGELILHQPALVDGGTALLFPRVNIQVSTLPESGTLKVSCSKPLRDSRTEKFEDRFKGCDVLWQSTRVAKVFFRTTVGENVEVPEIFVKKGKSAR